jgi:UDPglucose--hexose-1-phosphate uridylyltransferase
MNDQPELRRDPVTGSWVAVAPERAKRPIALSGHQPRQRANGERHPCPFCPGQEHATPHEVFAFRDPSSPTDGPGWQLRVVPNMYPAVRPESLTTIAIRDSELLESVPAYGTAEVLIECPEHIHDPKELTDSQFTNVFVAYRERLRMFAGDTRLAHVAVFKNVGAEAGASLGHTHSQIIALPVVPDLLRAELDGAKEHFSRTGRCIYCDLVSEELKDGSRVIATSANFVVIAAFAPRFAYEVWILPRQHQPRYEALSDANANELARLMKRLLFTLDAVLGEPAYNWHLHTTPLHAGEPEHYHWHLELLPRTARPAGIEWGFGCHITTAMPEVAARELRAALPM